MNENYIVYHYHTENWFRKGDNYKTYFLYKKKNFHDLDINKLEDIKYIIEILYKNKK